MTRRSKAPVNIIHPYDAGKFVTEVYNAVQHGSTKLVDKLLRETKGFTYVQITDPESGRSAASSAIDLGQFGTLRVLVKHGILLTEEDGIDIRKIQQHIVSQLEGSQTLSFSDLSKLIEKLKLIEEIGEINAKNVARHLGRRK